MDNYLALVLSAFITNGLLEVTGDIRLRQMLTAYLLKTLK